MAGQRLGCLIGKETRDGVLAGRAMRALPRVRKARRRMGATIQLIGCPLSSVVRSTCGTCCIMTSASRRAAHSRHRASRRTPCASRRVSKQTPPRLPQYGE